MVARVSLLLLCGWMNFAILDPPATGRNEVRENGPPEARREALRKASRYFLHTGIEPAPLLDPLRPRTAEDQRKLDALTWFCLGRRYTLERRWHEALQAYQKALDYDPDQPFIYEEIIRLCRILQRQKDLQNYLRKAIEVDPQNHHFLSQLALQVAEDGDLESAEKLLERALQSPRLPPRSFDWVRLSLMYGNVLERAGKLRQAVAPYRTVLEALARPRDYGLYEDLRGRELLQNSLGLYEELGRFFMRAKEYDLALEAFRRAQAAAGPRGARFYLDLAEVYLEKGQQEEALAHLERYIKEQVPQGSRAYELLARVLEKLGRQNELLPRLEAAAARDPANAELRYFLAQQYEKEGLLDKAQELYQELMEKAPDSRVFGALARLYRRSGRTGEALQLLERCVQRLFEQRDATAWPVVQEQSRQLAQDKASYEATVTLVEKRLEENPQAVSFFLKYFLARTAAEAKDYQRAARLYRLCRDERPQLELLVVELHEVLMRARRYQEAAENLRWALREGPWARTAHPMAYAEVARALLLANRWEEALTEAQRTVELMPDRAVGYVLLSRIRTQQGQYEAALKVLKEAQSRVEGKPEEERRLLYELSHVYYEQGDLARSEDVLQQILRRWPEEARAYNDLGYIWADHGKNLDEAERLIRRALELYETNRDPEDPSQNAAFLDSLGWVLYKKGNYQEARKYLEEAVAAPEGDDGVIWDHLGDVYERLGMREKAREAWRRALKLLQEEVLSRRERSRIQEIQQKLGEEPASGGAELRPAQDDSP
jgi:tetratricopeptide (TPR) repeat protein